MTRLACVLSQTLPRSCAIHQVEASIGNLRRLTASDWFALRSEASPSTDLGTQSWCIAPKYISGIAMVSSQRTKYIFSLKVGHFNESILHTQRISTDDLWKIAKNINVKTYGILIFKLSRNKLIVILGIYQPHFEVESTAMRLVFIISNPSESNDNDIVAILSLKKVPSWKNKKIWKCRIWWTVYF